MAFRSLTEASEESSGYLVNANETVRIPGWKLNNQEVAMFEFAGKKESYATQSTGSSANTGVIGMMAFKEEGHSVFRSFNNASTLPTAFGSKKMGGQARGMSKGMSPGHNISASCSSGSLNNTAYTATASLSSGATVSDVDLIGSAVQTQNLGTAFGESASWATTTVSFKRGDLLALTVIYYDNVRGLKARGVPMERIARGRYTASPQAFPGSTGDACVPPAGWRG